MSTLRPERCQESPTPDTHAARRISELLSRDEIATLTRASDRRGALALLASYALIATALALPALWPHPLTIAVSLVLLGGRQLALAVLMHECAHRSLFASRVLNELVGRFLCAAAIWNRLDDYRQHHIKHHNHTGTKKDPDLGLVDPFPVDGLSLARKLLRDLLGVTGLKRVVGQLLMDTGHLHYTASTPARWAPRRSLGAHLALGARHLAPVVGWQLLLIAVLWSLGHAWLYWLWLGAWLTTYSLFLRIRSMAELRRWVRF